VRLIGHPDRVRRPRRRGAPTTPGAGRCSKPDHGERRFVAAHCPYSHAVDTREAGPGVFDQEEAERFARAPLMPAEAFAPVAGWGDAELAELFAAPLDQIAIRCREAEGEDTDRAS
jgi:hypothetical protein